MSGEVYRCLDVPGFIYDVDGPTLKATLTATVTVYRLPEGDGTEPVRLHSDRLVLDQDRQRRRFADAAGIDPEHLVTLREWVIAHLTAPPAPEPEQPAPAPLDPDLEGAALALLDDPRLLDQLGEALRQGGYAGDVALPKGLYLALCTRGLDRPTNVQIDGPSSAGKTYLVDTVIAFFPQAAYYEIAGSSPRALVYSDENLQHRFLIVGETDGMHHEGMGASLIRGLVWGNKLIYETVESTSDGVKPRRIEKEGPTGLITTGTKGLEPELATRMLTLSIPDDPETTRQILAAIAARANGQAPVVDLAPWQAAQTWLDRHGCWEVIIPFASALAACYPAHLVRARRDFVQLLELIKASAVLHQRQRTRDDQGRIMADERDYRAVYELAGPLFGVINAGGVTPAVRRVVEAVAALVPKPESGPAMALQVAESLGLDKSVVSRHVRKAIGAGHLINEESRTNQPMKLRPGDPLLEAKPALPDPKELFDTRNPPATGATVQPPSENPHAEAEHDGCTSGCSPEADATGGEPEPAVHATTAVHATGDATADSGSSAEESGERLHGFSVAPLPGPAELSGRPCLDCPEPAVAGAHYCARHGGRLAILDPLVLRTVRNLTELSAAELAQYRAELQAAPADDPNLSHDWAALAIAEHLLAGAWPPAA